VFETGALVNLDTNLKEIFYHVELNAPLVLAIPN